MPWEVWTPWGTIRIPTIEEISYEIYRSVATIPQQVWAGLDDYVVSPIVNYFSDAFSSWAGQIESGLESVSRALGGAMEAVYENLSTAVAYATQNILSGVENVYSAVGALGGQIQQIFTSVGESIENLGKNLYNAFATGIDWLGREISYIGTSIQELGRELWAGLQEAGEWIVRQVQSGMSWISEQVEGLGAGIEAGFRNISSTFTAGLEWIGKSVTGVLDMLKPLEGFFTDPLGNVFGPLIQHSWEFIRWIGEQILTGLDWVGKILFEGFQWVFSSLEAAVAGFLRWVVEHVFGEVSRHMRGAGSSPVYAEVLSWLGGWLAGEILTSVRNVLEYEPPATWEKAWDACQRFMSLQIGYSLIDTLLTYIDKIIWSIVRTHVVGTGLGYEGGGGGGELSKLFSGIYWSMGLGWLSWMTMGPMLRAVIGDPLEEYYRWKYRTRYPTESDFEKWFRAGLISEEALAEYYRRRGYPEEYIPLLMGATYREVSISTLAELWRRGLIDTGELATRIRLLGYRSSDVSLLVENIRLELTEDERKRLLGKLLYGYTKGYVEESVVRQYAGALGLNPAEVEYLLQIYRVERDLDLTDQYVDTYVRLYREEKIDEETLRTLLASLIVDPARVEAIVDYEKARKGIAPWEAGTPPIDQRIAILERQVRGLEKQIEWVLAREKESEAIYMERISMLRGELMTAPPELRPTIEKKIERLRKEWEEREKEYQARIRKMQARLEDLREELEAARRAKARLIYR